MNEYLEDAMGPLSLSKDNENIKFSNTTLSTGSLFDLITDDLRQIVMTTTVAGVSVAIAGIGVAANIINMLVLTRVGFADNVNISLCALAVSDVGSLVAALVLGACSNPLFSTAGFPVEPSEFQSLVAAWPRGTFTRITSCLTAFITLERCMCVVAPLKVKGIITSKVTALTVASVYLLLFMTLVPEYLGSNLGWKFYPQRNTTLIGIVTTDLTNMTQGISFKMHTVVQLASFFSVIVFTSILVFRIQRNSAWRLDALTGQSGALKTTTKRDVKIVKMVMTIAVVYIVCFVPSVVGLMIAAEEQEFSSVGLHRNAFLVTLCVSELFEDVNSTLSIVLYYKMSSRYKKALDGMCSRRGFETTVYQVIATQTLGHRDTVTRSSRPGY